MSYYSTSKSLSGFAAIAVLVIGIVCIPIQYYMNAWAMFENYKWFLAGVPGFPQMTMLGFIGLSLVAGILKTGLTTTEFKTEGCDDGAKLFGKFITYTVLTVFGAPLFSVLIGFWMHNIFAR